MKFNIMVSIIEMTMLVTIGKMNTKLSFLMTISPGSLKKCILGKIRNRKPTTTKIIPKIIKNFAKLVITSVRSAKP